MDRGGVVQVPFHGKTIRELRLIIRQVEAPGEVHGYIRHKQAECLNELTSGSIRRRSTDEIFNLAHTYRLECMQKLVKDYTDFERLLSMKAPRKEVKAKREPEKEAGRIKDVTDMRQENWSVRKLRKLLDNKIEAVENVMREGLESASTDYCRFFEWKAAYLYKGSCCAGITSCYVIKPAGRMTWRT